VVLVLLSKFSLYRAVLASISARALRLQPHQPHRWSGPVNANCPPPQISSRFKISNTRLLALQCSSLKVYQPHYSTSQKYIFNVHHITTSGGKFNIFFWQGHGQKVRLKCRKTRQVQRISLAPPYTQLLAPSSLLDPPCVPQPRITARFAPLQLYNTCYEWVYVSSSF